MSTARLSLGWTLAFALLAFTVPAAFAFEIPANDGLVTVSLAPGTTVLTQQERDALALELEAYDRETSNQIAIVILQSLQGEAIEDVGIQIARKWGVGSTKNNGILILFSYDDRQVRMDVGYGLEGAVPDIVAGGIINEDMIPRFRDGQYAAGFEAAIAALKKHIGGEYTADRYRQTASDGVSPYVFFAAFILLQWLLAVLGRTKSWWLGGVLGGIGGIVLVVLYRWWLSIPALIILGALLDFIVSANYHSRGRTSWWAGGGWGPGGGGRFGGGGGFGGFGGGGFGGGGASGRW